MGAIERQVGGIGGSVAQGGKPIEGGLFDGGFSESHT